MIILACSYRLYWWYCKKQIFMYIFFVCSYMNAVNGHTKIIHYKWKNINFNFKVNQLSILGLIFVNFMYRVKMILLRSVVLIMGFYHSPTTIIFFQLYFSIVCCLEVFANTYVAGYKVCIGQWSNSFLILFDMFN